MPLEAPQHFGECAHVGSDDRKVSAGELRPQAEGDVPTCANRETENGYAEGQKMRHRVMKVA